MAGRVSIRGRQPIANDNRAGSLKVFLSALGVLLASSASAQYLEATIMLPDTLGPLNGPYCLACTDDSAFPRLYIGGAGGFYPGRPPEDSGGVIVANALTCKRLARIPTGPAKALCYVPTHNKLYVSCLTADSVQVVDCAANEVVSAIHVAGEIPVMQYNSENDRLYCGGDAVTVVDCSVDTVLHTIPVAAISCAFDSADNKLYCGSKAGSLAAVKCGNDSLVATIPLSDTVGALCYNPTAGKVYAAAGDTLYAVSVTADSVVAQHAFTNLAPVLASDPERNRVYCVYGARIASIDCAGDSVVLTFNIGPVISSMACDVVRARLYVTFAQYYPKVAVCDATSGQRLRNVPVDGLPSGAVWSQPLERFYCLPQYSESPFYQSCLLSAVSGASDSIAGMVPITAWASSISLDTVGNKLYFMRAGTTIGFIGAVDCQRHVATSYIYAGESPGPMVFNPNNNHLYWSTGAYTGVDGTVTVFDCTGESVVTKIPVIGGVQALQLHLGLNKLYGRSFDQAAGRDAIYVLDCAGDTVAKRLILPGDHLIKMMLVREDDRLWYLGASHVVVIDCIGDSIVADACDSLPIDDACACPEDRKVYGGYGRQPAWVVDMDNPALVETLCSVGDAGMRFFNIPGRHKVYWCANYSLQHATFRTIDSRTNEITAVFNVPWQVSGMCLSHTGEHLYCACFEDSLMLVVDTRADSIVATLRLPTWPSAREPLAANRSTNRIYVAQFGGVYGNGIPVIRDSIVTGLEELMPFQTIPAVSATLVNRGETLRSLTSCALYDASGRRVTALRRGQNDISGLTPGVYFVREEIQATNDEPQDVRKIVIAR